MIKQLIVFGVFVCLAAMVITGCGGSGGQVIPPPGFSPNIEPPTAPDATVGVPYNLSFRWTINNARPPFFWNLIGNMPPGLQFEPATGRIYGTPTTPGTFAFTLVVRDSNIPSAQESRNYTLVVGAPIGGSLTITTTTLPTCKVGVPYMADILATGGLSPYTWSMDGNLVPGLSLNPATGRIEGKPTTTGTYTFTARVYDSQVPPAIATRTLTIQCIDALQITTPSPLPEGEVGVPYAQQLQAIGGVPCSPPGPPYIWSFESGFLPAGLTLNADGTITGTPTTPGTYDFLVRVRDCDSPTPEFVTKNLSVTVKLVDADRFVCVDGIYGDDAAGDGTSALPFKTINRALAYVSANNLNPSLPRIGAVRIAGSNPPLEYHESVTLNTANGTNVSLLGGWYGWTGDFCAYRSDTPNAVIIGLGGPAITTNGLTRSVLIEQLKISGDSAISSRSTAIRNDGSSPTIARNEISGGNASGANSVSEGIWNNGNAAPLIVQNSIYGGTGSGKTRGIFNDGLFATPEIRDNTIDGGDPSGGGNTTSVGIENLSTIFSPLTRMIYDNTITGGTGFNAYGTWNNGRIQAIIARNTIDCEGSSSTAVCAAIYVINNPLPPLTAINANRINTSSSTLGNLAVSSRGIWIVSSIVTIDGNNDIDGGEGSTTAYGILVENGSNATIGGTSPGQPNSISGGGCFNSSTNDTWSIKVSSNSVATIVGNTVTGGCGTNTSTGIGIDPAAATITGNSINGNGLFGTTVVSYGIRYNGMGSVVGVIAGNRITGGDGNLAIGIQVEDTSGANNPDITENIFIRGAEDPFNVDDGIGIRCINSDPTIRNNTEITGNFGDNQAVGIWLDDCDNVTIQNNTLIQGGESGAAGWSVGIRSDFSGGVTISNNPLIRGGGSFVSTGIFMFSATTTLTGNTIQAGNATGINEGAVYAGSGGPATNNVFDAFGPGGIDAYGVRLYGCSNPSFGPNGRNTFQGASGAGWNLWDGNIANPGPAPFPCGVSPLTVNAQGNFWGEAPAPAGLQCGPGNDSSGAGTRNYRIENTGQCLQF